MIRTDLRAYLASKTTVTNICGTRIHWTHIPQRKSNETTYPCVVFRRATGGHEHHLDGSAGYAAPLFDIDVWGEDDEIVENLGEQVRLVLQGFQGVMGSTTIGRLTLDDEHDYYYPSGKDNDRGQYLIRYRYTIGYTEAIPSFS